MIRLLTPSRHLAALVGALALSACASAPGADMSVTSTATAPSGEVDMVQAMLMQGNINDGKKQLKSLLKRYPMDARLMLLRQSISGNPTELLGPASYAYTVGSGDTVEGLAERLLGNRLKAYQLARYNGLKTPAVLTKGQVIRIPGGERPRDTSAAPVQTVRPGAPSRPTSSPVAKTPSAPAKTAAQPAAAMKARTAGLAALNRGAIGEAVRQLQRANALDPDNAQIQKDLDRARRIAKTVRNRR